MSPAERGSPAPGSAPKPVPAGSAKGAGQAVARRSDVHDPVKAAASTAAAPAARRAAASKARPTAVAGPTGPAPWLSIDRVMVRLGWTQLKTSRTFMLALLVTAVPLIGGILAAVGDSIDASRQRGPLDSVNGFDAGYGDLWIWLVLYTSLPLAALLLAGGLLADEVEDRTISYLLVRPIKRRTLYLSRLLPVAATVAGLGALQSIFLGLTRLAALVLVNPGDLTVVSEAQTATDVVETASTGWVLLLSTVGGALAAALAGAGLAAIFGFVSLAVPKFHFVANLLFFLVVELPFSMLGGLGPGILTVSYYARSIMGAFDMDVTGAGVPTEAHWALAIPGAVLVAAAWTYFGLRRVATKDFHVTSAAA